MGCSLSTPRRRQGGEVQKFTPSPVADPSPLPDIKLVVATTTTPIQTDPTDDSTHPPLVLPSSDPTPTSTIPTLTTTTTLPVSIPPSPHDVMMTPLSPNQDQDEILPISSSSSLELELNHQEEREEQERVAAVVIQKWFRHCLQHRRRLPATTPVTPPHVILPSLSSSSSASSSQKKVVAAQRVVDIYSFMYEQQLASLKRQGLSPPVAVTSPPAVEEEMAVVKKLDFAPATPTTTITATKEEEDSVTTTPTTTSHNDLLLLKTQEFMFLGFQMLEQMDSIGSFALFTQAMGNARLLENKQLEARALYGLASAQCLKHEFEGAAEVFLQAATLFSQVGFTSDQAEAVGEASTCFQQAHNADRALSVLTDFDNTQMAQGHAPMFLGRIHQLSKITTTPSKPKAAKLWFLQ